MNDIDKELEKILAQSIGKVSAEFMSHPLGTTIIMPTEVLYEYQQLLLPQIKTVILEALKAEMPEQRGEDDGIRLFCNEEDLYYNQAIDDCLEVINKLLGDSNAE